MRTRIFAAAAALALALSVAGTAVGASVSVEGQCFSDDAHSSGGGGSVGADDGGNVDAVDAAEVQSVAAGLATVGQGFADDAQQGNPGGDACENTDDDDGDGVEEDEDGLWGGASAQGESAGACYDNEGFHTTADCDDGSGGDLPSGALVLH